MVRPVAAEPPLPFPDIDPIAFSIGPFAIRWYALAYLGGVLLGALYGWTLLRRKSLWAKGSPPFEAARDLRFRLLGGDRHRGRRPARLRAVLQSAATSSRTRPRSSPSGTAACPSTAAWSASWSPWRSSPAPRAATSSRRSTCSARSAPSASSSAASPTSSTASSTAPRPQLPWGVIFPTGGPNPAPSEPALRGRCSRASCSSSSSATCTHVALGAAPARPRRRHLRHRLCAVAHPRRVRAAARRPDRLPLRRLADHGHGAEPAHPRRRPRTCRLRAWPGPVAETPDLGALIDTQIRANGPMSVADYMALCLSHPRHGYYRSGRPDRRRRRLHHRARDQPDVRRADRLLLRQPLAADGPAAELHPARTRPRPRHADGRTRCAPRASADGFLDALHLQLFETQRRPSAPSRQTRLGQYSPYWAAEIDAVGDGPLFVVANEFFDALPIRQFVKTDDGWHERLVGLARRQARLRPLARADRRLRRAEPIDGAGPAKSRARPPPAPMHAPRPQGRAAGRRHPRHRLRLRRHRRPARRCRRCETTPSPIRSRRPARPTSPPTSISAPSREAATAAGLDRRAARRPRATSSAASASASAPTRSPRPIPAQAANDRAAPSSG